MDAKGDLTDSMSDDIKGKALQVEGKAQELFGNAKDAARDLLNKKP